MPNSKLSNTGRGRGNLPLCFYAFEFFYNLLSLLLSHSFKQNLHADRHVAALLAVKMGFVIASPRDKNHRDLDLEEGGAAIRL